MQWTDKAIILSVAKYSENNAIVSVLTENNGRFKGLVRNITSAKNRGIYQSGNLVLTTWKARLSEHLGFYSSELIKPFAAVCMHNAKELTALSSLCILL